MSIILNDGQKNGIMQAVKWYFDVDKKPLFFLAGSAGTGKSTCASTAVEMMGLTKYQVIYVTPTGKAATVLRQKGCIANTIHSTFYHVMSDTLTGKIRFARKKKIANGVIKLIIIDEFSMVNGKMVEDIVSFGVPILALGDPGQLPPMYSKNPYLDNPDVFLTEVMRQKGESGILHLATLARNNVPIDQGNYIESKVCYLGDIHNIEEYDIVLCATNKAREDINRIIRRKLGIESRYPVAGEKLVCLKNDYENQIIYQGDMIINPVNGMMMENLVDAKDIDECVDYLDMVYTPDFLKNEGDFKYFSTRVSKLPFDICAQGGVIDSEDSMNTPADEIVLDFGYAVTVHKSQGSEWPNVLVIDDYRGAKDLYKKWLYTAITRASKSVTIARE